MPHVRQQIRDAFATKITGLTTTSTRVYKSRAHPLTEAELPAWRVGVTEETLELTGIGAWAPTQLRTAEVVAEGFAQGTDAEATADTMLSEVETAVFATSTAAKLGLLLHPIALTAVEVELDGEGQKTTARVRARFTAVYRTAAGAPGTAV